LQRFVEFVAADKACLSGVTDENRGRPWDRRGTTAPELAGWGKHASSIKSSGEPGNASVQ
jgi:hypothetical protein